MAETETDSVISSYSVPGWVRRGCPIVPPRSRIAAGSATARKRLCHFREQPTWVADPEAVPAGHVNQMDAVVHADHWPHAVSSEVRSLLVDPAGQVSPLREVFAKGCDATVSVNTSSHERSDTVHPEGRSAQPTRVG